jgi:DsbC/DsbD-like thiol-disulfide interchange protein
VAGEEHFGYCPAMQRRSFLGVAFASLVTRHAVAAQEPYAVRLLKGGFDGAHWWMGFGVTLSPHWKTYWRVPGAGGIAPDFKLVGQNLKTFEALYPIPKSIAVELVGTIIGYEDDVVFPIKVTPADPNQPVNLLFKSFIGVCQEVCIPVRHASEVHFSPQKADAPDQAEIVLWKKRVPVLTTNGPIKQVIAELRDGKPAVSVASDAATRQIFIEGNPLHYFSGPQVLDGRFHFTVNGAKTLDEIRATPVRITMNTDYGPLEQIVRVD